MTLPLKATTDFRSDDPRDRCQTDVTKICRVCGDAATGMYFGALVCVPCKTFFLRYAGDGFSYECKYSKKCDITTATRTQCKFCRYQKCLMVGMCRRVRPAQIEAQDGQQLCVVCQDVANGVHFGVLTCEGCKKFFRRGLVEQRSYRCRGDQNCSINPSNRNACRFCRFKKCLRAGMSREAIQMGRPSKMSVFENSHGIRLPQTRDATDLHPIRVAPSSDPFSFRPGLELSTEHRSTTAAPFPSWMEDPLMGVSTGEGGRNRWTQIDALRRGWHPGPLVGKFPSAKLIQDDPESDRSGGSTCPDSTMVAREEADPFLPFDFGRSFASGEEESFHGWTEAPMADNFRRSDTVTSGQMHHATSPVAMTTTCKLEVLTSDDDGETTSDYKRNRFDGDDEQTTGREFKRSRYDTGTSDECLLPQGGCFDLPTPEKYSPTVVGNLSGIPCIPGVLCGGSEDVSSSGIVGRAFVDVLLRQPEVRNPVSDLDDQGCCGSDGRIGSPSVSSSSCPLDLMKTVKVEVEAGRGLVATGESASGAFGSGCSCQMTSTKGPLSSERSEVNREWREPDHAGSLDPDKLRSLSTVEEIGNQCWQTIKGVIPAYHRFVNSGTVINGQLKLAYQSWKRENPRSDCADELSLWIQTTVVPAYTTISVTYCKSLPDFTLLSPADQRTLIAGGQSESRILVAALHWYDASERQFRNFLSWREDCLQRPDSFKSKLRDFADRITKLHLDPIEAALLNAVGVFSTDYPNLKDSRSIEGSRAKILTTMESYIASNNSAPGERLEILFRVLREAQSLGAEHVALTNTRNLGLPTADNDTNGPASPIGPSAGSRDQSGEAMTPGQANNGASISSGQSANCLPASGHFTSRQFSTGQLTVTGSLTTNDSTPVGHSVTTGLPSSGHSHDEESPKSPAARNSPIVDLPLKKLRRENSPHGDFPPIDSLRSKPSQV